MSLKQLCGVSMLAYAMSSPGVASAADLSVSGQVRSDSACSLALGNGGFIDLGNLSRKDLLGGYYSIRRDMPLMINCHQPTKVGVNVTDNRAGTLPPGRGTFGLGNPAIGSYRMHAFIPGVGKADGWRPVRMIHQYKSAGGSNWWLGTDDDNSAIEWSSVFTTSWGEKGQRKEPVAFKTLTDRLEIMVYFKEDSAFTDEFAIDGSLTMELVYL
ncbi:DUF1120 domain-containing protein [Burkholderia seminalis]|uniref:DUF1120 domain-containing protein n=1 Tax=Burkholderia seminalis TaxID=488731 RepID=UPI0019075677|nr:DUF1120 domain-containing protein [Burkholderia seminalis]MBJ9967242.1 DUF1120 domain-containing protein [Burkholderia seminalis]